MPHQSHAFFQLAIWEPPERRQSTAGQLRSFSGSGGQRQGRGAARGRPAARDRGRGAVAVNSPKKKAEGSEARAARPGAQAPSSRSSRGALAGELAAAPWPVVRRKLGIAAGTEGSSSLASYLDYIILITTPRRLGGVALKLGCCCRGILISGEEGDDDAKREKIRNLAEDLKWRLKSGRGELVTTKAPFG